MKSFSRKSSQQKRRRAPLRNPAGEASNEPLRHLELSEKLAYAIASGAFPVGERFPTEFDLKEKFRVGRHTVRQALQTLSDQGLIVRKRKVGTMVRTDKPRTTYSHLIRDIRGLLDFAGETSLAIQHIGMVKPGEALADYFPDGSVNEPWLRVAGVRYARHDNAPLSWSEIFVPKQFPLDRDSIREGKLSIYEYCKLTHGLKLDFIEQEIRATTLPDKIAGLLQASKGDTALIVVRKYYDQKGRLFEVSLNMYPALRYSVKTIIRQQPA